MTEDEYIRWHGLELVKLNEIKFPAKQPGRYYSCYPATAVDIVIEKLKKRIIGKQAGMILYFFFLIFQCPILNKKWTY